MSSAPTRFTPLLSLPFFAALLAAAPQPPSGKPAPAVTEGSTGPLLPVLPKAPDGETAEELAAAFAEPQQTAATLGMEIIELTQANIFHLLPKAHNVFPVLVSKLPEFSYGPYSYTAELYQNQGAASVEELARRITAMEQILRLATVPDEMTVPRKIHLADLKALRARLTLQENDLKAAAAAYADVYPQVPKDVFPQAALNMANVLLLLNDTVSAMPIVKKVHKEYAEAAEFRQALNAVLIELYFIAGRYDKAWTMLEDFIAHKEMAEESESYRLRAGDVLFFLKRYQEAADWYQTVLKPETTKTLSENLSWLYLAESVFSTGNREIPAKIFQAMQAYFEGTVYGDVIAYRLSPAKETADAILGKTRDPVVRNWLDVEELVLKYKAGPEAFTGDSFNYFLVDPKFPEAFRRPLWVLQASAYANEKKIYTAIRIYQKLMLTEKNPVIRKLLDQVVVAALLEKGASADTEKQALAFLRFLRQFEFRARLEDPQRLFETLKRNLDLLGMKEVAAEMTLHIIEKSIHEPKDRTLLSLRLAQALSEAGITRAALRALDGVDVKFLDFSDKELHTRLRLEGLIRIGDRDGAIELLDQWEKEGASAKHVFWIALKKTEILLEAGKDDDAAKIVERTVGTGGLENLPADFDEFIAPLLAHQVVLNNRSGRHYETLAAFHANRDRILATPLRYQALLAALSSAITMNKKEEVTKLMGVAKDSLDGNTYDWLAQWTRGELWINEINNYLERRETDETAGGG